MKKTVANILITGWFRINASKYNFDCWLISELYKYRLCLCMRVGHLGVWGELVNHKRPLVNPPSQFSRLYY